MTGVFVAEGGRAVFRLVEMADSQTGESLEVLSGLKSGDRVVVMPPATLVEGSVLEVQP